MKPRISEKILAEKMVERYKVNNPAVAVNDLLADLIITTKGSGLNPSSTLINGWLTSGGVSSAYLYYLAKVFNCQMEEFYETVQ